MAKKIAYMVPLFPTRSETFIIREIQTLLEMGFSISIFAMARPKERDREGTLSHSTTRELCYYARPDSIFKHIYVNLKNAISHPFRYFRICKIFLGEAMKYEPGFFVRLMVHFFSGIGFADILKEKGIQHIHGHFSTGTDMGLAASSFLRIPFSFTAHASGDIFVKPILLEEKIRRAKFVVAVSEYAKKYLDSVTGYKYSGKFHRVYNGVSIPSENSVSKDGGGGREEDRVIKIVSVGRLVDCKGFKTLLDACKSLKQRGRKFKCEIIGDGPERGMLVEHIKKLDLNENLSIRGSLNLEEVYSALSKADVFVLLSEIGMSGYRDGLPTVIIEAMSMGLPVVSTWVSGIPEMVVHGTTGFLVHERDQISAADAIDNLICNGNLRMKLGEAGRERSKELFNLNLNIHQLASLFSRNSDM